MNAGVLFALVMIASITLFLVIISVIPAKPIRSPSDVMDTTPDPRVQEKARLEAMKQDMLKRANLSGPNPNDKYQHVSEIFEFAQEYREQDTFLPLFNVLRSKEAMRFSHDNRRPREHNVALYKTHKTASTTLASVLFRFAARHQSKIFQLNNGTVISKMLWPTWEARPGLIKQFESNMVLQHLSGNGKDFSLTLDKAFYFFNYAIKNPKIITILRNPIAQTLSWTCFYLLPQSLQDVPRYLSRTPWNIQSLEFGVKNDVELNKFFKNDFDRFELVCLAEMFDEGLVLLRRRLNWDLVDITYIRLLDSEEVRFAWEQL